MKKISKLIKGILLLLQRPSLLNLILKDEAHLKAVFERSFLGFELKEIDVFAWPEAQKMTVTPYAFLSGSSLPTDFALLQVLCKNHQVENYLEIGTWRGESAANVAPFVQHVFTLNLPDETLRQLGQSEAYIASHRHFSTSLSNVTHLFGDSATFDWQPYYRQMDLVFVDGDHSTEAVERDTKTALKLLKSSASILVWHDAKADTEYPRYEVLLGILKGLPPSMHQDLYFVKNTLCAVYLPKQQAAQAVQINALPKRNFKLTIEQVS